jgi:murein DD-endopeptidase MepM/ murein hydrolase activator NlpD
LISTGALAPIASAGGSNAAGLERAQRRLDEITERIRVGTAVWLDLVRDVHRDRERVRRGGPGSARARRELAGIFQGWIAVKRSLHQAYREMKVVFEDTVVLNRELIGRPPIARLDLTRWERAWPIRVEAPSPIRLCPVQGPRSVADSFGAPRPGGRIHEGNDVFAAYGTPVVAVDDGVVTREPNTLGGRAVVLRTSASYFYYAHLSEYGHGGRVRAGDVIGLTGTTGDAKGLIAQVHFEYHPGAGPAVDPFPFLQAVC